MRYDKETWELLEKLLRIKKEKARRRRKERKHRRKKTIDDLARELGVGL